MPDTTAEKDTFGIGNPDAEYFFNPKRSASKALLKT
jgi:hypothetical protein